MDAFGNNGTWNEHWWPEPLLRLMARRWRVLPQRDLETTSQGENQADIENILSSSGGSGPEVWIDMEDAALLRGLVEARESDAELWAAIEEAILQNQSNLSRHSSSGFGLENAAMSQPSAEPGPEAEIQGHSAAPQPPDPNSEVMQASHIGSEIETALSPSPEPSDSSPPPSIDVEIVDRRPGTTFDMEPARVWSPLPGKPTRLGQFRARGPTLPPQDTVLHRRVRYLIEQDAESAGPELKSGFSSLDDEGRVARWVHNLLMVAFPNRRQKQPRNIIVVEDSIEETISLRRLPFTPRKQPERSAWNKQLYDSRLDLDGKSIRLLKLQSGTSARIFARLEKFSLEHIQNQNPYCALSYCWSDDKSQQFITVNDIEVPVGRNLLDALESLRHPQSDPENDRYLWVDALCLNQEDVIEKSWELPNMGKVYEEADIVRIFLGRESRAPSISRLFDFLNRATPTTLTAGSTARERAAEFERAGVTGAARVQVCEGLIELSRLDWWTRIWVLQEFYLAKREPCWHWGEKTVSNFDLRRDLAMLEQSVFDLARHAPSIQGMLRQPLPQRDHPPFLKPPFKTEIRRISDLISRRSTDCPYDSPKRRYRQLFAGCKYEHDLIYGLKGLFEPLFRNLFVDDYQISPEKLWGMLLMYLIRLYDWGDVFWWYPHRVHDKEMPASWLPDWRCRAIPAEHEILPNDESEEYTAPSLEIVHWILYAQGIKLGTVDTVINIPVDDNFQTLRDLRSFDQAFNSDTAPSDPANLSRTATGLLTWTTATSPEIKISLSISTAMNEWRSLTTLLSYLLSDPLDQELTLTKCLNVPSMDSLPRFCVNSRTLFFLSYIIEDFVAASILDYENFLGVLTAVSGASWAQHFNSSRRLRRMSLAADDRIPPPGNSSLEGAIERFLDHHASIKGVERGRVIRYASIIRAAASWCRDQSEFRRMTLGLAAIASTLQVLSLDPLLVGEDEMPELSRTIRTQLFLLKAVVEQLKGRSLFVTDNAFHGLSSPELQGIEAGDILTLVDGLSFPLVIRKAGSRQDTPNDTMVGCALVREVDTKAHKRCDAAKLPEGFAFPEKETFKLA